MGANAGKHRNGNSSSRQNFTDAEIADTMVNVPILTNLSEEKRDKIKTHLVRKSYKPGKTIIKQGDKPDGFYIIEEGEAEVRRLESKKSFRSIASLTAGDYFGERGLISNTARVASVVATKPCICQYLSKKKFQELFDEDELAAIFPKRDAVCAEATNTLVNLQRKPRVSELRKSPEQKQRIIEALKDNPFFSQYDNEHLIRIMDAMFLKVLKKGDCPIKQGQMGDHVYVSESGNFRVTACRSDGKVERTDNIPAGTVFGELALMYNSSRNATVTATEISAVWVLDRFTFRRIVLNTSSQRLKQYKDFLKRVPLLKSLAKVEREKVAEALDEIYYDKGRTIVREGDIGECMFIVRSGTAVAQRRGDDGKVEYTSGDYFGELALMDSSAKNRRQATVTALTSCVLLKLSRVAVNLLLGPVEAFMKKRMSRYSSSGSLPHITPMETPKEESHAKKLTCADLKVIGRLGNGAFGLVRLVEEKKNPGKAYALKAVSKLKVVRSKQESHILNEKRVLMGVRHPFVTRLYATFQDDRSLYFILEPCLGGELFTILRTKTSFSEHTSQFYGGTVVEIFDYLQKRNIVYRDLKPENLLLDARGFLKMTDFGFAKLIHGKTYTLCGTPDYLAPEIVVGKGHGKAVDWWTLGVLIYEMIAGYPPFYASKPMKTYAKILHAHVKYPTHFSNAAVDLIRRLLNRKPSERFGVTHGGANAVRMHKWFKDFDFQALMNEKLKPPIQPTVKSTTDIGNFRNGRKKDPEPPAYTGSNDWCKEF